MLRAALEALLLPVRREECCCSRDRYRMATLESRVSTLERLERCAGAHAAPAVPACAAAHEPARCVDQMLSLLERAIGEEA